VNADSLHCPVPDAGGGDRITLAQGEGGRAMRDLLRRHVLPPLANPILDGADDAAVLPALTGAPVLTTDSYVVTPLFFPGGDIGSLAVYGAANDLAVCGARPRWISLAFVIEEGLPLATLTRVLESVAAAARKAGVAVVTGDTKIVPRGAADQLFVNTTGLGELAAQQAGVRGIQPGDALLASGPLGRHGIAVLAAREGLAFDPAPASDSAPLFPAMEALRAAGVAVKAARDATRGGAAAVLHEWASVNGHSYELDERAIPITEEVRGACELLGLDPLHVACEGTMIVAVAPEMADRALSALREVPVGRRAQRIGTVCDRVAAPVVVRRSLGRLVPLDDPAGAPLPRIC